MSAINRRSFVVGTLGAAASGLFRAGAVRANVPSPYDWTAAPPLDDRQKYIDWMVANRGEDKKYLGPHFDIYQRMLREKDLWEDRTKRAFLMTPREEFCLKQNLDRAYESAFLDIGWGVTISGPRLVGHMTSSLNIAFGEKVLEVGTGSGYQSAVLSNLTDKVWSIEIIKPLAARTRAVYDALIPRGYTEYAVITSKNADGYYGWEEFAPFDKIVVTCGIDHVPPPLLHQLKPGGTIVIPVGPPGAEHVLKVDAKVGPDGNVAITRSDIYGGMVIPFVPFTRLDGDVIKGTHNVQVDKIK